MKGKLEFDLNDKYEKEAFLRASNVDDYVSLLYDIKEKIRDNIKHDTPLTLEDILNSINEINFDNIWS